MARAGRKIHICLHIFPFSMEGMQIHSESFRITSFLVNLRQRAGLYAVLNLIQDAGWQHAVALKWDFAGQGLSWVFTRQKLVMKRWPLWNETVTIDTWLRPASGDSPFVFRDYELKVGAEKIGECTSSFTLIDNATRKLAKPDWSPLASLWRVEGNLTHQPAKIALHRDLTSLADFEVRNSDLDLNNHVNNTRYAQWILDAVPLPKLLQTELHEYEINFLAETKKGDVVTLQQAVGLSEGDEQFQGWRKSDGKVVFSARMRVS